MGPKSTQMGVVSCSFLLLNHTYKSNVYMSSILSYALGSGSKNYLFTNVLFIEFRLGLHSMFLCVAKVTSTT